MRLRDLQEQVRAKYQATATEPPLHIHNPALVTFKKPVPVVLAPEAETAAVLWLRAKLATPQPIAPLIAEWVGERDGSTGRWIDDLMAARWALSVQAFQGEDNKMWWRLSHSTVQ